MDEKRAALRQPGAVAGTDGAFPGQIGRRRAGRLGVPQDTCVHRITFTRDEETVRTRGGLSCSRYAHRLPTELHPVSLDTHLSEERPER
jgi:hypothetical protein